MTRALDLAKRVPVFPCDNDKRPFTAHGFKDASTDPDLIIDGGCAGPAR